tara:strand:+ start:686 stop:904 length:219 start_codon:yes stop_codon:yes gene_type:complete
MSDLIKIIEVVLENSSLEYKEEISSETKLREDLGLDSLALAELAVRIEEQYDIDVFEDGLVHTVDEIMQKLS